jgi:recombination protein RecA
MSRRDLAALVRSVADDVSATLKKEKIDDTVQVYANYARLAKPIEFISTGNAAIDRILGGGIPVGRTVEIFGPYSSGKTLLMVEILAQVQKMGGIAMLQDIEHAYEPGFGERIGIDHDLLLRSEPDTIEAAFKGIWHTIHELRKKDRSTLLCIGMDSVAAASTEHEMKELDKADMTKAKAIGAWFRRTTRLVGKSRTIVLAINQTRQKIGVMFGSPETTPGGDSIPFHASQRIRVQQGSLYGGHAKRIVNNRKAVIAVRMVVDIVKNRMSVPYRKCECISNFTDGLLPWSGLADLLADEGIIMRHGDKQTKGEKGKERVTVGRMFEYSNWKFQAHEILDVVKEYPKLLEQVVVTGGNGHDDDSEGAPDEHGE